MKKLAFVISILVLAAFTAAAQNNPDNFLGTWKAVKKGKSGSRVLNVSANGGNLKIERTVTDKNSAVVSSKTEIYRTDESPTFETIRNTNGTLERKMTFAKANKLVFENIYKQTRAITSSGELSRRSGELYQKDVWTLSADGRTLTIESIVEAATTGKSTNAPSYITEKVVYEKQ